MKSQKLIMLLQAMEEDEYKAPAAYQEIINLVSNKEDKKMLRASQRDERKHHTRIVRLLKKEINK